MKTFIFGDIEGDIKPYQSTIECLTKHFNNNRFIFLGDIYDFEKSDASIGMIENILSYFFPIKEDAIINYVNMMNKERNETSFSPTFDNEEITMKTLDSIHIIRLFRKLWKEKSLKSCQTKQNKQQYWKSLPKNDAPKYFKYLFIFGNKEVEFIYDLINSKKITKITKGNGETRFMVSVDYFDSRTNEHKETIRVYTYHQLNIMFNYLSCCFNYYLDGTTLYTHCYVNHTKFSKIDIVVSGHNKGYGKFIDTKYNDVIIYLVDLSGNNENINNYIIQRNGQFQLFNDNINPKGLTTVHSII